MNSSQQRQELEFLIEMPRALKLYSPQVDKQLKDQDDFEISKKIQKLTDLVLHTLNK